MPARKNLFGNGIGTFNDRIATASAAQSVHDERVQGFATGSYRLSNFTNQGTASSAQLGTLLEYTDWIEVGLRASPRLDIHRSHGRNGHTAPRVNYNGQARSPPALSRTSTIAPFTTPNLFDAVQLKSSAADDIHAASDAQVLAMSLVALGQGVPFFLAGERLASLQGHGQQTASTPATGSTSSTSAISRTTGHRFTRRQPEPGQLAYHAASARQSCAHSAALGHCAFRDAFREFLEIRGTSGLFHMHTLAEVQANLHFLNAGPSQTPAHRHEARR